MPRISEILEFLQAGEVSFGGGATPETELRRPASLADAADGDLSFCGSTAVDPVALLSASRATLVLVDEAFVPALGSAADSIPALVPVPNARLAFVRVIQRFFAPARLTGIHPTAVVSPSARVHPTASLGPLCTVADDVEIGAGTVLFAGVHVYRGVRIGAGVTIHSGTVLGADGFGYERDERGELVRFPHIGGVVIEDQAEIGANSCVDRGSLGDTRIGTRARIDNLVHIGHNAQVGPDCALTAQALVGGSTRIGERTWIAPGALLIDRIELGADVVVGMGAVVIRSVPDGTTVMGNPARTSAEHRAQKEALQKVLAERP